MSGKIISFPTLDNLIKFNMLFTCCLHQGTAMVRVASVGSANMSFTTNDPASLAFEDYEFWLKLIHQQTPPKFANIGSILVYLRKPSAKIERPPIAAEVPLKVNLLTRHYINGELREKLMQNPLVTEEFIKVTGRKSRADTFSNLKLRKELNEIYQQIMQLYTNKLFQLQSFGFNSSS